MNGYRRGYFPQAQSNNPWYNPSMRGVDWAGGARDFRQTLMEMWQAKQMQEEQKRRAGLEEREMTLSETREERLGQPQPEKQAEYKQKIDDLVAQGMPRAEATKLVIAGREPKPSTAETQAEYKQKIDDLVAQGMPRAEATKLVIAGREPKPSTAETPEDRETRQQVTRELSQVKSTRSKYSQERDRLIRAYQGAEDEGQKAKLEPMIRNIEMALNALDGAESYLSYGKPLGPKLGQKLTSLSTSMNQVKSGAFFKQALSETQTPQAQPTQPTPQFKITGTVKESALPAGTQVFATADGTEVVNINGQWKKLIK